MIEDFFCNGLIPAEHVNPKSPAYYDAVRKTMDMRQKILPELSDEGRALWEEYENAEAEANTMYAAECYREGMKFMREIMRDLDS